MFKYLCHLLIAVAALILAAAATSADAEGVSLGGFAAHDSIGSGQTPLRAPSI